MSVAVKFNQPKTLFEYKDMDRETRCVVFLVCFVIVCLYLKKHVAYKRQAVSRNTLIAPNQPSSHSIVPRPNDAWSIDEKSRKALNKQATRFEESLAHASREDLPLMRCRVQYSRMLIAAARIMRILHAIRMWLVNDLQLETAYVDYMDHVENILNQHLKGISNKCQDPAKDEYYPLLTLPLYGDNYALPANRHIS
jgi:hypothetical protein